MVKSSPQVHTTSEYHDDMKIFIKGDIFIKKKSQ